MVELYKVLMLMIHGSTDQKMEAVFCTFLTVEMSEGEVILRFSEDIASPYPLPKADS